MIKLTQMIRSNIFLFFRTKIHPVILSTVCVQLMCYSVISDTHATEIASNTMTHPMQDDKFNIDENNADAAVHLLEMKVVGEKKPKEILPSSDFIPNLTLVNIPPECKHPQKAKRITLATVLAQAIGNHGNADIMNAKSLLFLEKSKELLRKHSLYTPQITLYTNLGATKSSSTNVFQTQVLQSGRYETLKIGVDAQLTLLKAGEDVKAFKQQKKRVLAAKWGVQKTIRGLYEEITKLIIELNAQYATIAVLAANLERAIYTYKMAVRSVRYGNATLVDLSSAQAKMALAASEYTSAIQDYKAKQHMLFAKTGVDLANTIVVLPDIDYSKIAVKTSVVSFAKRTPEFLEAYAGYLIAKLEPTDGFAPTLSASGGVSQERIYGQSDRYPVARDAHVLLELRVPILSPTMVLSGNVRDANVRTAAAKCQQTFREVVKVIYRLTEVITSSHLIIKSAKEEKQASKQAVTDAWNGLRYGSISMPDIIKTEATYKDSCIRYIEALKHSWEAYFELLYWVESVERTSMVIQLSKKGTKRILSKGAKTVKHKIKDIKRNTALSPVLPSATNTSVKKSA